MPMSFDAFVQSLMSEGNEAHAKLAIPVKEGVCALVRGQVPLNRRHGSLDNKNHQMAIKKVTMTLREALQYCYGHDECMAFAVLTADLSKPLNTKIEVRVGQFDYLQRGSEKQTTYTTWIKRHPEQKEPVGLTFRLCNSKGVSRTTYLAHVLQNNGYTRISDTTTPSNFMFFSHPTFYSPHPAVRFTHFETASINQIDDKRSVWKFLAKAGQTEWMPKVHLSLEAFIAEETAVEESSGKPNIYFIKDKDGVSQRGVWCQRGVKDTVTEVERLAAEKGISAKQLMDTKFMVQNGIQSLTTFQGKKYNMRVYVIVTNHHVEGVKVYLFESVHMRVFSKEHDEDSTDPLVNIGLDGSTYQCMASEMPEWDAILPQIRVSAGHVCRSFPWDMRYKAANAEAGPPTSNLAKMAVLGFDYLVDGAGKPWVIEVNGWPCVEWANVEGRGTMTSQYKMLMDDVYTAIIAPVLEGTEPSSVHLKAI